MKRSRTSIENKADNLFKTPVERSAEFELGRVGRIGNVKKGPTRAGLVTGRHSRRAVVSWRRTEGFGLGF